MQYATVEYLSNDLIAFAMLHFLTWLHVTDYTKYGSFSKAEQPRKCRFVILRGVAE